MSGHYATLLRGTVARMAESCEVYVTDWADARMVPVSEGHFDLDDYIDYVIEFLEHIAASIRSAGVHAMAVCQPSVPVFAATAILNMRKSPGRAAHTDDDGRADRHAREPDHGQRSGDGAARSNGSART